MSRNKDRRRRELQKQRERKARKNPPPAPPANMRFKCGTCGTVFELPQSPMIANLMMQDAETGRLVPLGDVGTWSAPCLICGQPASPLNEVVVRSGDFSVSGFADTPEQAQRIRDAISELERMHEDASLDEVIELLERQGPVLGPLAGYLRENHLQLAGLGVGIVALVISLLAWLLPRDADDDPPPPPTGITHEQMDELIREIKEGVPDESQEPGQEGQQDTEGGEGDTGRANAESEKQGRQRPE